ncbi:hypothetical protein F5882DRAFT_484903 [Hyaloscypha sp. PMI_1271]|nr:hypothetical protein F5882DRAFT_484903 [Hyaloscypha sp. PMI_1271]
MAALISSSHAVNGFSDPLFHQSGIVPVVNLFDDGYWRLIALNRILFFCLIRLHIYYHVWLMIKGWIWLGTKAVRLLGFRNFNPGGTPSLKRMTFRITIAALRKWPNTAITQIWWQCYQLFADEGDFEMDYVAAWRHKFEQSNNSGPALHVHLYVENSYLKAPIPTGPDDEATFRALQMWYCLIQFRMGLGEILLPKRLTRIDRVQICKVELRPVGLGSKIESLVLGRSKNSHTAFFDDPERVKGQVTVTQKLMANAEDEGLEFVRSWNTVAIAAIILLPFVLSLVFGGIWIGLFVKKGTDVQVAVQTAFTVASYIVTAGALLIALIAFIDSQALKDM